MAYHCRSEEVDLVLGTMDDEDSDARVRVASHIFTSQRAGWDEIGDDGAERFERFPAGFEEAVRKWEDAEEEEGIREGGGEGERGAALVERIRARWFLGR